MTTKSIEVRSRWLGHLKNHEDHNNSIGWYPNGQKHWEIELKNGTKHGKSLTWFKDGQKYKEAEYKEGKLIS